MLDIGQQQYFSAVAEEEHVGRTAERLHVSQTPLSRQSHWKDFWDSQSG